MERVKGFKYFLYLLRWFLIGRNFCDLPKWAKKCFWVFHKLLWIIIAISLCSTTFIFSYAIKNYSYHDCFKDSVKAGIEEFTKERTNDE